MRKLQMKATFMYKIMIILIFLIAGLYIGGFYFAQSWLHDIAVGPKINNSKLTTDNVKPEDLTNLKTILSQPSTIKTIDKTSNVYTAKQTYKNVIETDLNKYATNTGINITIDSNYIPTTPTAIATIKDIQSAYIKVTIENPVSYAKLIKFIKAIETNLPIMKLTGINLSRGTNSEDSDSIKVEPLIIEVYTK